MASAGGKEVGRVSIRVVPNTDGFRDKVERDLRDLDGKKVKINPDFDSDELEREIDRSKSDVEVGTDLKNPGELKQKVKEAAEKASTSVDVEAALDESGFRTKVRSMIETAKSRLVIDADLDPAGIGAQALYIKTKAEMILRDIKAKVNFDENGATAKAIAWAKATERAIRLKVKVALDTREVRDGLKSIGQLSEMAVRPFYRMFGGEIIEGVVKGFTRFKGAIAIATMALSAMGVVLAPIISSAWDASVALVKVAGAIAPSVIVGGALAYGALFKAFEGFGSVLKAQSLVEFNDAVTGLGPEASRAAAGLFEIKQAYNQVTEQAQEKFWGRVTTDLSKLAPAARYAGAAVNGLASRFGSATDRVAKFFTSDRGMKIFKQNIDGAATSMGNLVVGLTNAVPGLSAVGAAGASTFAKITRGISGAATEWSNNMIDKLESGELEKSLDKNLATLSRFWENTRNVGTVIGGVFAAMNREGSGLLAPLSGVVAKTAEWVQSAEGVQALDTFFGSIGNVISTLAPVFAEVVGTVVRDVVPALSEMIVAAGPGLEKMGGAISSALQDIAPHLPAIGEGLGSVLSGLAPVVEHAGPLIPVLFGVAAGFKVVGAVRGPAKAIGKIGKAFRKLRKDSKVGPALKSSEKSMASVGKTASKQGPRMLRFGKHLGKVGTVAKFAGKGFARLVPGLGTALLLADAGRLLVKHWEPAAKFADEVKTRWNNGMESAKKNLEKVPDRFKRARERLSEDGERIKGAWDGIKDKFKKHNDEMKAEAEKYNIVAAGAGDPGKISENFSKIKDLASSAWAGISEAASKAWDNVGEWWSIAWDGISNAVSSKWDSIKESASSTWSSAKELVSDAWEGVGEMWSSTWEGIKTTVSEKWDSIKETASSVWSGAKETVSNAWEGVGDFWSNSWSTTKDTVGGIWTGIKDHAATTWTNAKDTVSTAWDGVSESWTGAWTGVQGLLGGIWDGIKSNASSAFDGVSNSVSSAWDSVSSDTSSAWSSVSSEVAAAVGAVVADVISMVSQVVSNVTSMGSTIVSVVTGAIASFVSAISSGFNQAVSLAASLPGRVRGAMGNLGGMLVSSGVALVQGFISGIRSMIGAVASAAQAVVSAARSFFPFSPAKKGPFSGRGYTTYSGKALAKDFAGGMRSEISTVSEAAEGLAKAANKPFEQHHRDKVLQPVLESNAKKIAAAREKELKANKDHEKRIAEIRAKGSKNAGEQVVKENKKHAEKIAEIRKDLDESIEAPDYSDIDLSFREYYIEGMRELLSEELLKAAKREKLVAKTRQSALAAVKEARATFGNHPVLAQVELNVNSKHFEDSVYKAIEESGIGAVPVDFVIANLDQLKSDLGMGDGVVSRAIDQAVAWNWNDTDAKRYRDNAQKTEVHYHVEDMQEAIRRENLRVRKQLMKTR